MRQRLESILPTWILTKHSDGADAWVWVIPLPYLRLPEYVSELPFRLWSQLHRQGLTCPMCSTEPDKDDMFLDGTREKEKNTRNEYLKSYFQWIKYSFFYSLPSAYKHTERGHDSNRLRCSDVSRVRFPDAQNAFPTHVFTVHHHTYTCKHGNHAYQQRGDVDDYTRMGYRFHFDYTLTSFINYHEREETIRIRLLSPSTTSLPPFLCFLLIPSSYFTTTPNLIVSKFKHRGFSFSLFFFFIDLKNGERVNGDGTDRATSRIEIPSRAWSVRPLIFTWTSGGGTRSALTASAYIQGS